MVSQGAVSNNGKPEGVSPGAVTNGKLATVSQGTAKPGAVNHGTAFKNGKPVSSSPQSNTSGLWAMLSRVSESTRAAVGRQRPWSQLMDQNAFDKPASFADAMSCMLKNIRYFRMKYIIVVLVVIGVSLLLHPMSLVVLALLVVA